MQHYIKDRNFKKGIGISHLISNSYSKDMMVIKFKPTHCVNWKIRQWGSAHSLYDICNVINNDQEKLIVNKAKKILIKDGSISLYINGKAEYTHDRKQGEGWPHLLIEQFFSNIKIFNLNNLHAKINFDFVNFEDHMGDRRTELHTFQVGWYFAIGNKNKNSKGYDDFYWFGLPFIDTPRLPMGKPYEAIDVGKEDSTNKYIINISASNYLNKPTEPGDNYSIDIDILPYIKEAFEKAKSKGYMRNTALEDLELISTNFGIENTGTFSGEIKVNEIDIYTI